MLTHEQVWRGVDALAHTNHLSASGLARRAGLDPTTFNKSKRCTKDGRPRWPSTESIAKILQATQTSFGDFVGLVEGDASQRPPAEARSLPFGEMALDQFDSAGFPTGESWDRVELGPLATTHGYVVELDTQRFEPVFREGDVLVVDPEASIRRLDRVLVATRRGQLLVGILQRRTATKVSVLELGSNAERLVPIADVAWLARVTWASQ